MHIRVKSECTLFLTSWIVVEGYKLPLNQLLTVNLRGHPPASASDVEPTLKVLVNTSQVNIQPYEEVFDYVFWCKSTSSVLNRGGGHTTATDLLTLRVVAFGQKRLKFYRCVALWIPIHPLKAYTLTQHVLYVEEACLFLLKKPRHTCYQWTVTLARSKEITQTKIHQTYFSYSASSSLNPVEGRVAQLEHHKHCRRCKGI